jgi:enoyl-CoA hydratase
MGVSTSSPENSSPENSTPENSTPETSAPGNPSRENSSPERGISVSSPTPGVRVVTVDFPPVNALPVRGWFALADAVRAAGRDAGVRCVVLAAEGRGFNAGVDIKEIQARGRGALIGANRGCFKAFAAVYECEVPVVAAVRGFCLGGGIGLVGNADAIVASEDAVFGLPELDRGALGAATHLARLVPQHLMRALYYTSRTASAAELHAHGSVWRVVPREELRAAALELAREIAAKDGELIRLAKAAINGIDPVDVRRSYRFEQGFTFEANLSGVADRVRDGFGEEGV